RADDGDALTGEIDARVRPATGEVHLAREAIDARDVGSLRVREAAGCHHVEAAADLVAPIRAHPPAPRPAIPDRGLDTGLEADVAAEAVLVRDVAQVAENLGLRRVALRPLPLLLQLGIEAVGVVEALDVAPRTGVAVPVPRAADVAGALEHHGREPERAEPVERVETGEPSAHDHDVDLGIHGHARGTGVTRHAIVLARSVPPSRQGSGDVSGARPGARSRAPRVRRPGWRSRRSALDTPWHGRRISRARRAPRVLPPAHAPDLRRAG